MLLLTLLTQFVQLEQNGIWENGKRTGKYQMSGARVDKVVRRSPGFWSGQELRSARDNSRANGVKLEKKPSVSVGGLHYRAIDGAYQEANYARFLPL